MLTTVPRYASKRFIAVIVSLAAITSTYAASAQTYDYYAQVDQAQAEAAAGNYASACRDYAEASTKTHGWRSSQARTGKIVPTLKQANQIVDVARAAAAKNQYALACTLAYGGAIAWHVRGDEASTDLINREAIGYAQKLGLPVPTAEPIFSNLDTQQAPKVKSEVTQRQIGHAQRAVYQNPISPREATGAMPIGRYTCYMANTAFLMPGSAGSVGLLNVGAFLGNLWIYDEHHYANEDEKPNDRGTYTLGPDGVWSNVTGAFVRVNAELRYLPHGVYKRPTIAVSYRGMHLGFACTKD